MTLGELLGEIRDAYLQQFREEVERRRRTPSAAVTTESIYRTASGEIDRTGQLQLPLRLDIQIASNSGRRQFIRVQAVSPVTFDPIDMVWAEGMRVTLCPFDWDECELRIEGLTPSTRWDTLAAWFHRWFDEGETKAPLEAGLRGVVHYLSDPEFQNSTAVFGIDFGSAPLEAFEDLVDTIERLSASATVIGRR